MERKKIMTEMATLIRNMAVDVRALADFMQVVCDTDPGEQAKEAAETKKEEAAPVITLEKIRGVLADKSRKGHTEKIRELIEKYGADRLSDVDPKDYPALLQEAEGL